jgi:hypothetical protein
MESLEKMPRNLQIKMEPEERLLLKKKAARASMKDTDFVREWLLKFIEETDAVVPKRNERYFKPLDHIVEHGSSEDRSLVLAVMENICQVIAGRGGPAYRPFRKQA